MKNKWLPALITAWICVTCFPLACIAQDDSDKWDFKEEIEIGGSEAQALRSLETFARRMFDGKKFDRALAVLANAEKQAKEKWPFIVIQCWKAKFLEAKGKEVDANALMDKLGERVKDMPVKGNDGWLFELLTCAMPRGWRNAKVKELGCDLKDVKFNFVIRDTAGVKLNVSFDYGDLTEIHFPEAQGVRLTPPTPPPGNEPVTTSQAVPTKEGPPLKVEADWGAGQRGEMQLIRIVEPPLKRPDGQHSERYTWKTDEGDELTVTIDFGDGEVQEMRLEQLINFWKVKK